MIVRKNLSSLGALVFGAALVSLAGSAAYAQGQYDPYYGNGRNHQKQEKRAEKQHQKADKEALKQHQREERGYYGNDSATREHQRQEREQEKYHRRAEEQQRKAHQRDERGGYNSGSYGNGGYYDPYGRQNGGYGNGGYSGNGQAVFDRGYQEGVRAGRDDRARNRQYNYEDHRAYRDASGGYGGYGDADAYREGFRRGYDEGYRNGSYRRSNSSWGRVLGGILGRP